MPISMNSLSASIAATPADVDCSSSASCSTRSLPHPLDIGLHALALKHKTTTCSGHCTQAATPLAQFLGCFRHQLYGHNGTERGCIRLHRGKHRFLRKREQSFEYDHRSYSLERI